MFLVILLAIVAVIAALNWLLVRGRGRAYWFPNRPGSSLPQLGDGHAHHSEPTNHGGGQLDDGHASGGHMDGGH
jgi:hypothetical protein